MVFAGCISVSECDKECRKLERGDASSLAVALLEERVVLEELAVLQLQRRTTYREYLSINEWDHDHRRKVRCMMIASK